MRDYDAILEKQDLSFKYADQVFTMRLLPHRIYGRWMDEDKEGTPVGSENTTLWMGRIREALDNANGQVERWDTLVASDQGPPVAIINDLVLWLIEVQTSFPTEQPQSSPAGAGSTGTSSRAKSR